MIEFYLILHEVKKHNIELISMHGMHTQDGLTILKSKYSSFKDSVELHYYFGFCDS